MKLSVLLPHKLLNKTDILKNKITPPLYGGGSSQFLVGIMKVKILAFFFLVALITPMITLLPNSSAELGTKYVDATNCPNAGDGTISNPYCSINDAVLASSSGDTIEVASGTYALTSSIEINHPLTMNGAQDGNSALQRTAGDSSESIIDSRGVNNKILIMSSDVSISGFELHGDEDTRCGVYVAGGSNNISNIEISDNLIHGMAMKLDALRASSWGILTDAVEGGQILHTIDGLHIHGNHIYDIGGFNDSIGLGISIHEVVSSEVDGGALIENNRFSNIHDGKWAGAAGMDVPGMGVFTHEQTSMYPGDYLSGITLRGNEYANISVGAALQISERGVFEEENSDFQSVGVYLLNVDKTTTVIESKLAPFASTTGKNMTLNIQDSLAYFASPSKAIKHTLEDAPSYSNVITISSGTFDEDLVINATTQLSNLMITTTGSSQSIFTGGVHVNGNYGMSNITLDGLTILGEKTENIAVHLDGKNGLFDLTVVNMVIDGGNSLRSGIVTSGLAGQIIVENNNFVNIDGNYVFTSTPDGIDTGAGQISALSFSNNIISDSTARVRITPVSGLISQGFIMNNTFSNSGSGITPLISINDVSSLLVEENNLHNINSDTGILIEDAIYLAIRDNNLSSMDNAIKIIESSNNQIQSVNIEDNSFTEISNIAVDVPTVTSANIAVNQNWFGTTNITEIIDLISGDAEIGEQWNSWPGQDSDNDGWADEFDLCPENNDAIDIDNDGIPDGCDSLIDNDDDGISNGVDNCLNIPNPMQENHDNDIYGDICDDDDDNDGMPDLFNGEVSDYCPKGYSGWVRTEMTDPDNDGCYNFHEEDNDDDNDGVLDDDDGCQRVGWFANLTNDIDNDGCQDSLEDTDDDNDGVLDETDSCPTGELDWESNYETDFDNDGCRDSTEDDDDDNDMITDNMDDCSNEFVTNETDENDDGCIDEEPVVKTPFSERLMKGEMVAVSIVFTPLLLLLIVGSRYYIGRVSTDNKKRLMVKISTSDTLVQLNDLSTRANDMYLAKAISEKHHSQVQEEISERKENFDSNDLVELEQVSEDLERVWSKAIVLGLTTKAAVSRMKNNILRGKFDSTHYLKLWSDRIDKNKIEVEGSSVIDEVSKPKLTKTGLNKMKKAELVDLAKKQGLMTSGTKATIIERILEEEE